MTRRHERLRGLYAITPGTGDTRRLVSRVEACLEGGAGIVQYRAKDAPPALALEQAMALARLCRERHALFIVNDSVELALRVQADGVHVGRDDSLAQEARRAMPGGIVGVSCYADVERARAAGAAGADYIGIGSMFPSGTKPHAVRASPQLLAQAKVASGLPVAAIGGITPENAGLVVAAGADMVAVISALFDAPDIRRAARAFCASFLGEPSGVPDVRT